MTTAATSWTERYLAAALRDIPGDKRADVERELRSSITDAIDERVAAGEDPEAAERAVLEGLGDPSKLATAYTGRPNYLIGPALFPVYRYIVPRLIVLSAPVAAIVLAAIELLGDGTYADAVWAGVSGAVNVTIQIAFWGTLAFAAIERAEVLRDAREEIAARTSAWKLEYLPAQAPARVGVSETVGEVVTTLFTIGAVLFFANLSVADGTGARITIAHPTFIGTWLPVVVVALAGVAAVQAIAYVIGRWTMPLATLFALGSLGFGVPVVWLALSGSVINPAFAAHVGLPGWEAGNQIPMLAIAVGVTLVTAWEIIEVFGRARGSAPLASRLGGFRRSV